MTYLYGLFDQVALRVKILVGDNMQMVSAAASIPMSCSYHS